MNTEKTNLETENPALSKGYVSGSFFCAVAIGITDYKGRELFEGDIMKHPNQDEIGVIRYEKNACQFRIQYDPKTFIPSCHIGLQMGKKGKCEKIGSVYKDATLLGWEEKNDR